MLEVILAPIIETLTTHQNHWWKFRIISLNDQNDKAFHEIVYPLALPSMNANVEKSYLTEMRMDSLSFNIELEGIDDKIIF